MKYEVRFYFFDLTFFRRRKLLVLFFLLFFFSPIENITSRFWIFIDPKTAIEENSQNSFGQTFQQPVHLLLNNLPVDQTNQTNQTIRIEQTIQRGMDYLAIHQNEDGSFGSDSELFGKDPGVAALCGMAFLASGCSPGRGKYGDQIDKIIDYLLSLSLNSSSAELLRKDVQNQGLFLETEEAITNENLLLTLNEVSDDFRELLEQKTDVANHETATKTRVPNLNGLIARADRFHSKPMYGHAYATLFLSECFGMSKRPDLKAKLEAAVNLIIRTQNSEGGWRYEPFEVEIADISVTTCQISALRAAKNAGFFVPDIVIDRALEYVRKCQNSDGGFRYMLIEGPSGYSRTAAAIQALQAGGAYEDDSIKKGIAYLMERAQTLGSQLKNDSLTTTFASQETLEGNIPDLSKIEYYYYGIFYATLAFWMESAPKMESPQKEEPNLWLLWEKTMIPWLLLNQNSNGSWESATSTEVSTAMILAALLISQENIPFFVR